MPFCHKCYKYYPPCCPIVPTFLHEQLGSWPYHSAILRAIHNERLFSPFCLPRVHIHSARRPSLVTKHLRTAYESYMALALALALVYFSRASSADTRLNSILPCCRVTIVTMLWSTGAPALAVLLPCCGQLVHLHWLYCYHVAVSWCTFTDRIVTMQACCGQLVDLHWLYCRHVVLSWCTCTDCIVAMLRSAGAPALTVLLPCLPCCGHLVHLHWL